MESYTLPFANKTVIYRSKDGYKVRMQKCNCKTIGTSLGLQIASTFSLSLFFVLSLIHFFIIPTLQIDSQISIDAICLDLATSGRDTFLPSNYMPARENAKTGAIRESIIECI